MRPHRSPPWLLLVALWLTSCGREAPPPDGHERYALAPKVWMVPAAHGAHKLLVASDGSVIALRGRTTSWIDPQTNAIIGKVDGRPISLRPWPTKYLSILDQETRFVLSAPGGVDDVPIAVPEVPGWNTKFVAALEVRGDACVLVLAHSEKNESNNLRERRVTLVRFRLADGSVTATRQLELPGVLSPSDPYTFVDQVVVDSAGLRVLLAAGSDDGPTGELLAVDSGSLEVAWRHQLTAVDRDGLRPRVLPGILLAGSADRVVAYVGELKIERGLEPNSLYVLDGDGRELRSFHNLSSTSHLDGPIRRIDLVSDDLLAVHGETNSRDFPRSNMTLSNVDLTTGQARKWYQPPKRYIAERVYMTTSAWDARRGGYWIVPESLHDLRTFGVKLPAHLDGQ